MLAGNVEHGDSLGNRGNLGSGDVQWMTAGRGIMHQEMPQGDAQGRMHGFQLWANLPSSLKMTPPRYQDIKAGEIPEITDDDGTRVRIVCGDFWGKRGPVEGVAADPRYLDVSVPPGKRKTLPVELERHAFAYVFEGSGNFRAASQPFGVLTEKTDGENEILIREQTGNRSLVLFDSRRRGHGAGRRRRHPLSAGLRQTDRRTSRLVRPHCDEYAGRIASGSRRAAQRDVHQIVRSVILRPALRAGTLRMWACQSCIDFRCCTRRARNAACSSGLHFRKPSPDLKPSLPSSTSFCR